MAIFYTGGSIWPRRYGRDFAVPLLELSELGTHRVGHRSENCCDLVPIYAIPLPFRGYPVGSIGGITPHNVGWTLRLAGTPRASIVGRQCEAPPFESGTQTDSWRFIVSNTLVMIMAGGKGSRLGPLTVHRSKPAVPFGGRYRIIDFVLSNFVNSGYRNMFVLTQYMASSLIRHLNRNWRMSDVRDFIEVVPAQMRTGESWYLGTADSVYQNLNLIRDEATPHTAVFGGDHIYAFAVDQMESHHQDTGADLTIAACPVPRESATEFGVIQCDDSGRVTGFQEKPANPSPMPGRPGYSLVSMGNYFFRTHVLTEVLSKNASDPKTSHDFGKDIIPKMVADGCPVYIYDFSTNRIPGNPPDQPPYWRDVGTIDSYFQANMDLRTRLPELNVYNRNWRIRTARRDFPPARFVGHGEESGYGRIVDSLVCEGSIISNATLKNVVVGYDCFIHSGSDVEDCVILSGSDIGTRCNLRRVLADKNCKIEPGVVIGKNVEEDKSRFPFVTESGIVLLPQGTRVPREGAIHMAHDQKQLLEKDSATQTIMAVFEESYSVSSDTRHSHVSMGPRYRQFSPEALYGDSE